MLKLTYTGLWLFFLGSKLGNTERTQHPRIKDDSSVLRERIGEQAADRRLPVPSLTDLGKTTGPCGPAWHTQCLYQPARLSVQPQTAACRAQAAGQTAQMSPTRLQGSPGSDRRVIVLEMTWSSGSQSQLHTRIP